MQQSGCIKETMLSKQKKQNKTKKATSISYMLHDLCNILEITK